MNRLRLVLLTLIAILLPIGDIMAQSNYINDEQVSAAVSQLTEMHGPSANEHIARGVRQVAERWRESDGTPDQFAQFCTSQYIADPEQRQLTADRFEDAFASMWGHFREMGRDLSWHLDIATGPLQPIDYMFARYSPSAHWTEDMFSTKIAFVALLNYPLYNLPELLDGGPAWTRDYWAQARLASSFAARVPAEVSQHISNTYTAGDAYIGSYNIFMHHLLTADGRRLFPRELKLVSHWNLRDELKAAYAEPNGLEQQELIYELMLRIIRQEIPEAVINNPAVDWNLSTNAVTLASDIDGDLPSGWTTEGAPGDSYNNGREPDTRYEHLLAMFHAQGAADEYYPHLPTLMDRRFERDREMPEQEVEQILVSVLSSEAVAKLGKHIEKRLGRPLRPYDIWYSGFKSRGGISEDELDSIVGEKYPSVQAFQDDMIRILTSLGFSNETATFLEEHIAIDPSRGIGHASGPGRRVDKARLRTRVGADGMDYKGYNIAIHEFGHNVEQVLSLTKVDHTLLRGVPNTAFTEGFAFVFQSRDLELLGVARKDASSEHFKTLDVLWSTYEIGGVALLDMRVWNWMYAHPAATPAELREAVISLAKDIWNKYYAPIFGTSDSEILAIYSHMIDAALYLPNYPLGHIIAFQVEEHLKKHGLASEMERMCKIGSVTPDHWMHKAVGTGISTAPLLQAAEVALDALKP